MAIIRTLCRLSALLIALVALSTTRVVAAADECVVENDGTCEDAVATDGGELTKIRLGLEWFVNPDHLPLIVAKRHGIFAQFGLDVELVEPQDHWEAEEEIIQGRLDVAVTEPLHLAQDAAKGKPVIGFSRFFHTDGGVMYNGDSGIKRPKDMCGKTISYPGSPGPGGPAIVHTMVKSDGGGVDCDISSYGKYNGGFFHTDAIQQGKADLATLIFWNFEIPEAKMRGLDNVSFFSLKDWGVPDFCQLVLMSTPERFQVLKGPFRQLILAMRRATGIIHQQPDLARQYYYDHVGETEKSNVTEAILSATLPAFPNDNTMASDYYESLMTWLVDTEQIDAHSSDNVGVSSYWTNEIAL
jgi:putative hydroxymethylpyrimidine transport system substrate-binding protein